MYIYILLDQLWIDMVLWMEEMLHQLVTIGNYETF